MLTNVGFRLLLITDRHAVPARGRRPEQALLEVVATALSVAPPGAVAVMLREKDLPGGHLFALASELRELTRRAKTTFLVNDRVDVALAAGADGVHLPSAGLPPSIARNLLSGPRLAASARAVAGSSRLLVGVSTHSLKEARRAADEGADYVTLGPVLDTPSKRPYGEPLGTNVLSEAHALAFPVFGLGGITSPKIASEVLARGAHGVACIRAVLSAEDPRVPMAAFLDALAASPKPNSRPTTA